MFIHGFSINFLEPSPFFFTSNQGIYDSVEADKEPLPGHWEEFLGVFEWAFRWCYNQNFWKQSTKADMKGIAFEIAWW